MTGHARIFLVEDEPHIAEVVRFVLEQEGFEVAVCHHGQEAIDRFPSLAPDLVLLDLNLPGRNGLEVFREIQVRRPGTPVIMLTSRTDEVDRVLGLEMGADDYITKPFSNRELAARVRAVLRRGRDLPPRDPHRVEHPPFILDDLQFTCIYFGQPLTLTRPEFTLLWLLVRSPARTFTRAALLDHIYDAAHAVTDRSIDAMVKRVRRKLEEVRPGVDPIETVYGVGYKLRHPAPGT